MLLLAILLLVTFNIGAFVSGDLYWLADVWAWTPQERLGLITGALFVAIFGLALSGRPHVR